MNIICSAEEFILKRTEYFGHLIILIIAEENSV